MSRGSGPRASPPNGSRQKLDVFALFRRTGDGYISLAEMSRYMRSVFAVIAETSPEQFEGFGVNPDELADATARRCFAVADVNKDGRCVATEAGTLR